MSEEDNKKQWRTDFLKFCEIKNHDAEPQTLTLEEKSTVLLPSGWIHCVYTPVGLFFTVYNLCQFN